MNLNKSTRYALHAALELAASGGRPVTAAQVARRHALPENVVAKVLQQLVRAGLARGMRGVGGGYLLARPARRVSVQDVIDVFEPAPEQRFDDEPAPGLGPLFREVDETVRATFESVSLATLTR